MVCGLLTVVAMLQTMGSRHGAFSSCGAQAWLPRGMWNLPRPGIKLVSPVLANKLLSSGPPGRSQMSTVGSKGHLKNFHECKGCVTEPHCQSGSQSLSCSFICSFNIQVLRMQE